MSILNDGFFNPVSIALFALNGALTLGWCYYCCCHKQNDEEDIRDTRKNSSSNSADEEQIRCDDGNSREDKKQHVTIEMNPMRNRIISHGTQTEPRYFSRHQGIAFQKKDSRHLYDEYVNERGINKIIKASIAPVKKGFPPRYIRPPYHSGMKRERSNTKK